MKVTVGASPSLRSSAIQLASKITARPNQRV
jgi:hypothetical protein